MLEHHSTQVVHSTRRSTVGPTVSPTVSPALKRRPNFPHFDSVPMKPTVYLLTSLTLWLFVVCSFATADEPSTSIVDSAANVVAQLPAGPSHESSRSLVLVASLTVFVLAVFVGFEIIAKVPPTLHTPLMSGSNAISGITVVGAIIAAGYKTVGVGSFLGMIAIVLAMINVVGGFLVTHRMLLMFKKR
jgi:H+-translocating NAD(P) transhydrogenase subunit alpha